MGQEGAVAHGEQNRNQVIESVHDGDVLLAVAIEVPDGDPIPRSGGGYRRFVKRDRSQRNGNRKVHRVGGSHQRIGDGDQAR